MSETLNQARSLSASEYTFGVEIETIIPHGTGIRVGGYHRPVELNTPEWPSLPNGKAFMTSSDSSINARDGRDCEFVSPVLKGETGIQLVRDTIVKMNDVGARVNASCGVHVHVGLPECLTESEVAQAIERLANLVGRHEAGIMASTGSKRRFSRNNWCHPIKHKVRTTNWGKTRLERNCISSSRYNGLNLRPIVTGQRRAVEFRYFSGSTNAIKIEAWIKMCIALVQAAVNSDRKTNPITQPAGAGNFKPSTQAGRELERLFQAIGWTGTANAQGGQVDNQKITRNDRKILRDMAFKFGRSRVSTINGFEELDSSNNRVA